MEAEVSDRYQDGTCFDNDVVIYRNDIITTWSSSYQLSVRVIFHSVVIQKRRRLGDSTLIQIMINFILRASY